jgi:hypothetical protein
VPGRLSDHPGQLRPGPRALARPRICCLRSEANGLSGADFRMLPQYRLASRSQPCWKAFAPQPEDQPLQFSRSRRRRLHRLRSSAALRRWNLSRNRRMLEGASATRPQHAPMTRPTPARHVIVIFFWPPRGLQESRVDIGHVLPASASRAFNRNCEAVPPYCGDESWVAELCTSAEGAAASGWVGSKRRLECRLGGSLSTTLLISTGT